MAFSIREVVTPAPLDPRAEQTMVSMRDGVRLATDVYLPQAPVRHGTVLIRDPYDKSSRYTAMSLMADVFNELGLVLVAQDCRGKFRSEGETLPYASDVEDAYDTVEWIIRQPWSNGLVGLHGVSYLGYTVWAGVASGHPAIRGAVPQGTCVDLGVTHVGSLWQQQPQGAFYADDLLQIWTDSNDRYLSIDYSTWPAIDAFEEAMREIGTRCLAFDQMIGRSRTGEIPDVYGTRHPMWTTNVPVLHWSNWFDPGLGPDGMRDFRAFRRLPGRRELHYLRAEAADHDSVRLSDVPYAEGRDPSSDHAEKARVARREALDSALFLGPLLGGPGALPAATERVRFEISHGDWRTSTDWPPPGLRGHRLYLTDAETAQSGPDGGRLTIHADPVRSSVEWDHDPANPVPSPVTPDEVWTFLMVYPDERGHGDHPGVVTFTSEPLSREITLCGAGAVHVAVATTAPSLHLFARLLDVGPDGGAHYVSSARVLLRDPDPDQLSRIDLPDFAYRVRAGHRLRLHLACSDWPLFIPYAGVDENPWFLDRYVTTRQTLITGGLAPSHLELTLLDEKESL